MTDIFTPLSLTISQVFTNGDPLYKIPVYQRPYSWKDEHVEKLWDDINTAFQNNQESKEVDSNYFLGSLIVVPDSSFEDIVDGQQRLTTLIILFNVLRTVYPNINREIDPGENPNVVRIGKINSCIMNTNEVSRLRLHTHANHQNDFESIIFNNTDFSSLRKPTKWEIDSSPKYRFINTAFIFHDKLISLGERVAGDFINYLFNQVKIIKITSSNRAFAIKLFQVLNDRGLDLSSSDLLKSILLANIKDDFKHNQFISEWQYIESLTEDLDVSLTELFTFYQYYLIGRNPKKSLVDELEAEFKGKDSNLIINDFKSFVKQYKDVLFEEAGDKVIYSMWYLPWATYWKTIMLTALHSGYSDIEGLKFSLRRFYYLYWIAGKTLTAVKQTSFNLIGAIKDKKTLTEINTILDEKIISDKIIGSVNQNIYGNIYYEPWAKALFLMIEYNHMEESFSTFYGIDKHLQLEHILPQSFTSREEWNYFNKEIGQKLLHTAGNLTLLYSKKNIEAKNYSFDDKMQIYQGFGKDNNKKDGITSFRISQKIVDDFCKGEFVQWTSEEIKDRGAWFITEIEEILKFELPKKIELQP